MGILEIVILAIVQGVAEFLPISSSGHLVVAEALMAQADRKASDLLEINIVLHVATLLAVMVVYWQRLWRLLGEDRRVIPLLIVGSIPAAIVGLVIKTQFSDVLNSPLLAGLMFPVTAASLLWIARRKPGEVDYTELTYKQALLIGSLQALAILPGISRSGATIVGGLVVGLRRDASAAFAFLLAVPVIAGAGLLEAKDIFDKGTTSTPWHLLAIGFVVAFLVGLVSLKLLIRMVERGQLAWFAYWLIPLGIVVTIWQLAMLV